MVDWLFKKYPRAKRSCDYCGTDKLGLGVRNNSRNTFCGPYCHAWYEHCVFTTHQQFELPLARPPDELVVLLRYPP